MPGTSAEREPFQMMLSRSFARLLPCSPASEGRERPRAAEVPFLTLFELLLFQSARWLGQTMLKVAPLGKRADGRAASKSEATTRSEGGWVGGRVGIQN